MRNNRQNRGFVRRARHLALAAVPALALVLVVLVAAPPRLGAEDLPADGLDVGELAKLLARDLENDLLTTGALSDAPPAAAIPRAAPLPKGMSAVTGIRLGDHGEQTRFVMELTGDAAVDYRVFTLSDPYRVVIDMTGVPFRLDEPVAPAMRGSVSGYRYGRFQGDTFRVVIDMTEPVVVARNFVLDPQAGFGRRIVLDLAPTDSASFARSAGAPAEEKAAAAAAAQQIQSIAAVPMSPPAERVERRRVVVIDAGHGGVDPGTTGRSGVKEKNIVLAFARELATQLRATGRYDVHLTRETDIFIPLRQRVAIARSHKADLFMSIHADAIAKADVRGLSVYTLSETASDSEAAALARQENRADLIGGLDLDGESPEVTGILIDLAQRETKNYSARFARSIVDYAGQKTTTLQRPHRFAGFVVLKAPDVPSVLIELGFLTNASDEKQLVSSSWRTGVAGSFTRAIDRYFGDRMAEGPQ
ncbi:MAG: N-acetylmuramoyl-L-alanine amidase [Parvibaculum sp.]